MGEKKCKKHGVPKLLDFKGRYYCVVCHEVANIRKEIKAYRKINYSNIKKKRTEIKELEVALEKGLAKFENKILFYSNLEKANEFYESELKKMKELENFSQ